MIRICAKKNEQRPLGSARPTTFLSPLMKHLRFEPLSHAVCDYFCVGIFVVVKETLFRTNPPCGIAPFPPIGPR